METIASNTCFNGTQLRLKHQAESLACEMTVSVYLPKQGAGGGLLPVVYWLSGLTCTDENFVQKAGAQRIASELGLVLVAPDTSPRGESVPDDPDGAYDLGLGAGFYVDATEAPWRQHYRMYSYISEELPALIQREFPVDGSRQGIAGHSMGGHGALTIALQNPERYRAVSAFAPIVSPMRCPWGVKALGNYLGQDRESWRRYDATELVRGSEQRLPMRVDQGAADDFLLAQLQPDLLLEACDEVGFPLTYHLHPEYDHSYFFIASFIEAQLRFQHAALVESD